MNKSMSNIIHTPIQEEFHEDDTIVSLHMMREPNRMGATTWRNPRKNKKGATGPRKIVGHRNLVRAGIHDIMLDNAWSKSVHKANRRRDTDEELMKLCNQSCPQLSLSTEPEDGNQSQ